MVVFVMILYPLYQMLILSLLPLYDIRAYILGVENRALRFIPSYFWPTAISFEQYTAALTDGFLRAYGVAIVYTFAITVLQFPFALVMGLVFAKARFKGRDVLFFFFIASMVLPFHVTVVPLNQILHRLNLFDNPFGIILLGAFSPLGVFLFRQFIGQVPDDVLEAAAIDGAGHFRMIVSIILPMIGLGLAMFFLLTITIQWSAIEPALAFIRSDRWLPVSLILREMMSRDQTQIFAPGVLYVLPMLVVYGVASLDTGRGRNLHHFVKQ